MLRILLDGLDMSARCEYDSPVCELLYEEGVGWVAGWLGHHWSMKLSGQSLRLTQWLCWFLSPEMYMELSTLCCKHSLSPPLETGSLFVVAENGVHSIVRRGCNSGLC